MAYTVHPVKISDAPSLSNTMMRAYYEDLHWRLVWRDMKLDQIIDGTAKRMPWNLIKGRDSARHQKVVAEESGEAIGYVRWLLLNKCPISWPEAQVAEASEEEKKWCKERWEMGTENGRSKGTYLEMLVAMGGPLEDAENEIIGKEPYLSVDYLTTLPSHQRRGVGGLLLRDGLKEADKAGVKTIVMASPAGVNLYRKYGFEHVRTVTQDDSPFGGDGNHQQFFMVRQPVLTAQEL